MERVNTDKAAFIQAVRDYAPNQLKEKLNGKKMIVSFYSASLF
jgi:hypothetical protein